jgi:hypothetical protein
MVGWARASIVRIVRGGLVKAPREKLTLWVEAETVKSLRAMAGANKVTLSQVAAKYLELAVSQKAETAGTELVVPALEAAINRASRQLGDRLANLLARTALEATTGRRMVLQLMMAEFGDDKARSMTESAWSSSLDTLKKPSEGVRELLGTADVPGPNNR